MKHELTSHPIHLGLGATAVVEPPFSGMEWYADYLARHSTDGREGRLVSMYSFDRPWTSWEMHPNGSEVVICTAGRMTLLQQRDGEVMRTELLPNQYAINEAGTWHTADVEGSATAIFITCGVGTEHRPRDEKSPA